MVRHPVSAGLVVLLILLLAALAPGPASGDSGDEKKDTPPPAPEAEKKPETYLEYLRAKAAGQPTFKMLAKEPEGRYQSADELQEAAEELLGRAEGKVIVLIHGGTVPMFAWDAQVPSLVDAGYRVLRYTQYGRGYSDRPALRYDRALYQRQLSNLLDALGIDGTVTLFGLSFGAATAATFAAENPHRVERLVFIAPVVDYGESRALLSLAKMPLLGEWFLRVFGIRGVVARATGFFERANAPPRYAAWFDEQTRIEGFERALLSFTRTDALESYVQTYAALGPQHAVGVLAVGGDRHLDLVGGGAAVPRARVHDDRRAGPANRLPSERGVIDPAVARTPRSCIIRRRWTVHTTWIAPSVNPYPALTGHDWNTPLRSHGPASLRVQEFCRE